MKRRFSALIGMLAFAQLAAAAEPNRPASFEALDVDKDGLITVIESKADRNVAARFSTADRNQDGYLTRAEFDAIPKS
jgi:Ca2+-binding EF-hand superfamily protein